MVDLREVKGSWDREMRRTTSQVKENEGRGQREATVDPLLYSVVIEKGIQVQTE